MKDFEKLSRIHFNNQAKDYDSKDTVYYSKEGKISCVDIQKYLENVPFERLLDVGCGTGFLIDNLAKERDAEYYGLDLSEKMIEIAKSKNIEGAEFVRGSANMLPYDDESFDVVTCVQSFHHYPYPDEAMKEVYRVLKKGGVYILSDTGLDGIGAWIDNHIIFPLMNSGDCNVSGIKGISSRMKNNGFKVLDAWKVKGFIYTVVSKK